MSDNINRDELYEIVLVFNGPLGMSPGKMAGQAFQAAVRTKQPVNIPSEHARTTHSAWGRWVEGGTRTITKVALTPHWFDKVCEEVPGYVMRDEGHTEVEAGAATVFVSYPFLHKDRPKILDNKKVPLL